MQRTLPEFYYLTHFHEFLTAIEASCRPLLRAEDQTFIASFHACTKPQQAILVRILNRRYDWVRRDSLAYTEIPEWQLALIDLEQLGWIRHADSPELSSVQVTELLSVLTKPELQAIAIEVGIVGIKKSASKLEWLTACQALPAARVQATSVVEDYLYCKCTTVIRYLLFIYFGRIETDLKQFSLRDLGVRSTHEPINPNDSLVMRFDSQAEAESAFFYSELRRELKQDSEISAQIDAIDQWPPPVGSVAERIAASCRYRLGERLRAHDPERACAIWSTTAHSKAQEQVVRLYYRLGRRTEAIAHAEAIMADPLDETVALFAEDFIARKVGGKRTSVLTDMLRDALPVVAVDEAYRGDAEGGVIAWHQRQQRQCIHSENNVWRALFGLLFWPELVDSPQGGFASAFDRTPRLIQNRQFYPVLGDAIEQRLTLLNDPQQLRIHLQQMAVRHYGEPTRLFYWHAELLHQVLQLTDGNATALQQHLRAMAEDFYDFNDGYPDLMIKDSTGVRFEEVKAPGDQLRRNQGRMIRHLRQLGFRVGIRPLEWQIDAEQPYVIVDVETTGGGHEQHRITEIAVVRVEQGIVVKEWSQLINPERRIPHAITELTGISNDMVAAAPLFVEVADQFLSLCDGAIFVAHNVNFDYGFLRREFARLDRTFRMPKLCTVQLARRYLMKLSSYRLSALCKAYGIELKNHHRALADARATAELFQLIQTQRLSQQGGS